MMLSDTALRLPLTHLLAPKRPPVCLVSSCFGASAAAVWIVVVSWLASASAHRGALVCAFFRQRSQHWRAQTAQSSVLLVLVLVRARVPGRVLLADGLV